MTIVRTDLVQQLRAGMRGRVVAPDDESYDVLRAVFPGGIDRRPAAIACPATAQEVSHVVKVARESGVPLAVRSGGHSPHASIDGGLVLDLRDMKAIEIDPAARTAWAEPGLTATEYSKATGAHGLATGFGDTGSVGIGGITLGGGIGYLTRKYGLTIDSLIGAEMVTANGEMLRVNDASDPDLFWAIRGGGGNFGVVTRFHFRLHPVDRIVGGMLLLPASADVIAGFMAAADAAPEELTTIANVMPAPPMPFVPAEHHGKLVVLALMCYAGDAEAGERTLAPFRALATPLADMLHPMAYPEIYPPDDSSYHPTAVGRTMFVERVDRPVAETVLEYLRASDATMRVAQLRMLGGAMARVAPGATAFAHRQSRIMINVAAFYGGEADRATQQEWVMRFSKALEQNDKGAYVNFLNNEGPDRVRAAYPGPTWDRLVAIKARYDPDNVFRLNENITV